MINVVTTVRVKKGKKVDFLKSFKDNLPKVKNESGVIEYFAATDIDSKIPIQNLDEDVIMILEKWDSLDSLHAHLKTAHMQKHLKQVESLIENVSIKVLQKV